MPVADGGGGGWGNSGPITPSPSPTPNYCTASYVITIFLMLKVLHARYYDAVTFLKWSEWVEQDK